MDFLSLNGWILPKVLFFTFEEKINKKAKRAVIKARKIGESYRFGGI